MKSMHPFKSYWGETISLPCILPQQKKKSKKGHNLAKILQMITKYWTWPVFYNGISFCKLPIKSMHPCKSYWAETNINIPTKTKSKKGHNSAKILRMNPNNEPDLYFTMVYPSANSQWHQYIPAKVIERKPISTHQQKLSQKRAITQPKFGGWLLISNLTSI